jgi:hypothetical protein
LIILYKTTQNIILKEITLSRKLRKLKNLISAIEIFILSNWNELEALRGENSYSNIVVKILGCSLTEDEELRNQLC